MNYIILDLEWDSAFCKFKNRFVNQIIQIGAVKLDENFEVVDRFNQLVRSSLSPNLTKRFTELTGITNDDMHSGLPLQQAVLGYNSWVGEDTVTVTWSNSDLYAIIDNTSTFLKEGLTFKIEQYADLQSYVQNYLRGQGEEITNQISLADAAEKLNISTDNLDLHTALDDSQLTAAILKKTYNSADFLPFIKDTSNPEFYRKLTFKKYYIKDIKDKRIKAQYLSFKCDKCGKKATQQQKWKYKNHWFTGEFLCLACGNKFLGRVMFKVTYSGLKVAKKILHPTPKTENNEATV